MINTIVLIPILIFAAYLIYGFRNCFFIIGALLSILGSFVSSILINEPAYTQLLKTDINDQAELVRIRSLLNKGNITRSILSLIGTGDNQRVIASLLQAFKGKVDLNLYRPAL